MRRGVFSVSKECYKRTSLRGAEGDVAIRTPKVPVLTGNSGNCNFGESGFPRLLTQARNDVVFTILERPGAYASGRFVIASAFPPDGR